jgi:hypothetical protein
LKINELPAWPPQWAVIYGMHRFATGEVGVLKSVRAIESHNDYVVMVIDHDGAEHSGMLRVDPPLREKVVQTLEAHKGAPIKEIAQLEF